MTIKIGIELEFLVAYCSTDKVRSNMDRQDLRWPESEPAAADPNDFSSRDFANNECLYKVCTVLAAYGLPVACGAPSDKGRQTATTSAHGGEVVFLEGKRYRVWNSHKVTGQAANPRFQYWFVTHESYITGKMVNDPTPYTPEGYSWYCVEISTPVIDDTVELDYGLPVVCAAIEELRREMKIYVNEDCGLHIHASPSNAPLSHEAARGVAALTCLIEQSVIYKACHRFRSSSAFCQTISEASQICQGNYGFTLEDSFSVICMNEIRAIRRNMPKTVQNEQDVFKKVHTFLAQSSLATLYNGIRNSVDGKMGSTMSLFGTFEFRYPEGSLDIEFIWFWVSLIRALFDLAMLPPSQFAEKLAEVYRLSVSTDKISSDKWMDALGLANRWKEYFRRRLELYKSGHSLNKRGILPPGRD